MDSGKTALGIVLGIGVGALLGVLFAPDKGSKTRKKIMDKGHDFADGLKGKFDGLYQDVTDKYDTLLEDAKSMVTPK
ncbi:YtxH domain-containing protein [Flavobacterium terrigena]|uniref:YtxH-like protein n=1 Tax=Flavobacterium terrigena TaxID=402734 RepID=A0A1H6Q755_9FLAO|nr:YtxH domain-containing protein [Flavobacterium terrigena]SEI39641.1 YtxH-like protein [Flavobacterium terrigena]